MRILKWSIIIIIVVCITGSWSFASNQEREQYVETLRCAPDKNPTTHLKTILDNWLGGLNTITLIQHVADEQKLVVLAVNSREVKIVLLSLIGDFLTINEQHPDLKEFLSKPKSVVIIRDRFDSNSYSGTAFASSILTVARNAQDKSLEEKNKLWTSFYNSSNFLYRPPGQSQSMF